MARCHAPGAFWGWMQCRCWGGQCPPWEAQGTPRPTSVCGLTPPALHSVSSSAVHRLRTPRVPPQISTGLLRGKKASGSCRSQGKLLCPSTGQSQGGRASWVQELGHTRLRADPASATLDNVGQLPTVSIWATAPVCIITALQPILREFSPIATLGF